MQTNVANSHKIIIMFMHRRTSICDPFQLDRRLVSADPVLSLTMIGWIEAKIKGHVTCETCHKIIQQRFNKEFLPNMVQLYGEEHECHKGC